MDIYADILINVFSKNTIINSKLALGLWPFHKGKDGIASKKC
tara:strand:+ start:950 stop:1075 length:126 start_codon:yes stop_codon:yes gene_type:complete